jgi:transposase
MRKGFDGLCALVTQRLQRDALSGDIFMFVSRDRIRAKTLQWDGTGLCLYAKRLERGRFAALWREAGGDPITLTISELDLFLDGSTLVGRVALAAARDHAVHPGALAHDAGAGGLLWEGHHSARCPRSRRGHRRAQTAQGHPEAGQRTSGAPIMASRVQVASTSLSSTRAPVTPDRALPFIATYARDSGDSLVLTIALDVRRPSYSADQNGALTS